MKVKVGLLIPCFNNTYGLIETLSTIFLPDVNEYQFFILIIDDGSKEKICSSDLCLPEHVTVIIQRNQPNQGITKSLNIGLTIAKENEISLIFRMDAGDRYLGDKIMLQLDYFIKNKLDICGTYAHVVNEAGDVLFDFTPPTEDNDIKKRLKISNQFIHPSILFNLNSVLDIGGYPDEYPSLEDWALFMKLAKSGYRFGTVPDFLMNYVISDSSISTIKRDEQAKSKVKLLMKYIDFNLYSIIGLIKNVIIMKLSREFLTKLKAGLRKCV